MAIVADRLRDPDRRELMAVHPDMPPEEVAFFAWGISFYTKVVCHNNEPIILYGVTESSEGDPRGNVWMVATSRIGLVSKSFLRVSEALLDHMLKLYPAGLQCLADTRNTTHIRWLTLIGFDLGETVLINDVPFIHATYQCAIPSLSA